MHGNNFDSNRGCQALRFCTSRILARYLPECPELHANIFCNENPMYRDESGNELNQLYEVKKERNLPFYLWGTNIVGCKLWGLPAPMKVISKMKRLRKEDATGILLALGGDNWSMDYGSLALHLFTAPFASAARIGFPTCVWGASIGPFSQNPVLEHKMAHLLRKMDLITVREPLTVEYLRSLGVTKNVRRVCDPAFLLPAVEPENLPDEIRTALDGGAVGINLAPLFKRYAKNSKEEFLNRVRETFLHFLDAVDAPVVMIPHVMMEPEVFPDNDDFLFMQSLRDSLPDELRARTFLYDSRNDDCRKINWVISRCRAFAGCWTHSTIAALSTGVPTFCTEWWRGRKSSFSAGCDRKEPRSAPLDRGSAG